MSLLVYAIGESEAGIRLSLDTLLPLGAAVALLGMFLFVESRVARHPLLPLNVLRIRTVAVANITGLTMGMAMFGFWFLSTLYMQNVLGYTPLQTGLGFVPHSLAIVAGSQVTSRLIPRFGNRTMMLTGLTLTLTGFVGHALLTPSADYFPHVVVPGVLVAFGMGLVITPLTSSATDGVGPDQSGLVSGLLNTSRQMGGSIGLGLLATVAAAQSGAALATGAGTTEDALSTGYTASFTIAAVIVAAAFCVTLLLPRPESIGEPS